MISLDLNSNNSSQTVETDPGQALGEDYIYTWPALNIARLPGVTNCRISKLSSLAM